MLERHGRARSWWLACLHLLAVALLSAAVPDHAAAGDWFLAVLGLALALVNVALAFLRIVQAFGGPQ